MNQAKDHEKAPAQEKQKGVTRLSIAGFKSISREQSIEIRPLTILAGVNSSGKSSMMQPLLLLKQTLEESYDPGTLLLYGPNVKFTSVDQFFAHLKKSAASNSFEIEIDVGPATGLRLHFHRHSEQGIEIQSAQFLSEGQRTTIWEGMTHEEILSVLPANVRESFTLSGLSRAKPELSIVRNRCFLKVTLRFLKTDPVDLNIFAKSLLNDPFTTFIEDHLLRLIHLPGLRGNPERVYPVTATGPTFPGTFEKYTAGVIAQWQKTTKDVERLERLGRDLEVLGLTWKVTAKPINDAQVELQVGRLAHATKGGTRDLVNIADVGFGVSQTLPVLVALHVATPGQIVYLEQPEVHLHPKAQSLMAQVLAEAANRGVRVIVETHSSLLLLGIQTLVAEGRLAPEKVKLHWFTRRDDGGTEVTAADLDEAGAFGEWPEDFAEVALEAESRYLDAAELRRRKNGGVGKALEAPRH